MTQLPDCMGPVLSLLDALPPGNPCPSSPDRPLRPTCRQAIDPLLRVHVAAGGRCRLELILHATGVALAPPAEGGGGAMHETGVHMHTAVRSRTTHAHCLPAEHFSVMCQTISMSALRFLSLYTWCSRGGGGGQGRSIAGRLRPSHVEAPQSAVDHAGKEKPWVRQPHVAQTASTSLVMNSWASACAWVAGA